MFFKPLLIGWFTYVASGSWKLAVVSAVAMAFLLASLEDVRDDLADITTAKALPVVPQTMFVVTVPADIDVEPIRWLFTEEEDADRYKTEVEPSAQVWCEPVATSWDDPHLHAYIADVRRVQS